MNRNAIPNVVSVAVLSLACTSCSLFKPSPQKQAAELVKAGREALLSRKPENALDDFSRAAAIYPGYNFMPLGEGVWTYVGRSNYDLRRFGDADAALGRATNLNSNDFMAKLYWGLTLIQLQPVVPQPVVRRLHPLSFQQVLQLLKSSVSADQIALIARKKGIDFSLNQKTEMQLKEAGGTDALVAQLKQQHPASIPAPAAPRPDATGVNEVKQGLEEMSSWLDKISQTPEGQSWDSQHELRTEIAGILPTLNRMPKERLLSDCESIGYTLEKSASLADTGTPAP